MQRARRAKADARAAVGARVGVVDDVLLQRLDRHAGDRAQVLLGAQELAVEPGDLQNHQPLLPRQHLGLEDGKRNIEVARQLADDRLAPRLFVEFEHVGFGYHVGLLHGSLTRDRSPQIPSLS